MASLSLIHHGRRLVDFYRDREYFSRLFKIAIPIAMQNLVMSGLNMVGVLMVSQLGDTAVAGVGLANQIFFLLNLMLFGITSGAAMFTAQLWGKRDVPSIRKVLGLALSLSFLACGVFVAIAEVIPNAAIRIYSTDPAVVALGAQYLRIFGWSFIASAVTFSFASVLRSVGDIKTPLLINMSALVLNTALSYVLIFGRFGLPTLGTRGAAWAILIARIYECLTLVIVTYRKNSPIAARLSEMFRFDLRFVVKVLKPVLPVAANEMLWSMGITTYSMVYARIGTESIAAMNIVGTIDQMALVIFMGIASACAILVGHEIGANDQAKAYTYAARSLGLGTGLAVIIGGLIVLNSGRLPLLFSKVSPQVIYNAQRVLVIVGLALWMRMINLLLFIGIFRSGGDTRVAFILDGVIIWVVGVPLALLGGFVLHLPVYWVYLLVLTEEFTKGTIGLFRFFSRKWIHNLAHTVGDGAEA